MVLIHFTVVFDCLWSRLEWLRSEIRGETAGSEFVLHRSVNVYIQVKSENVCTDNNGRNVNIFLQQLLEIQTSHELLLQASQFGIHVTKICHNYAACTF